MFRFLGAIEASASDADNAPLGPCYVPYTAGAHLPTTNHILLYTFYIDQNRKLQYAYPGWSDRTQKGIYYRVSLNNGSFVGVDWIRMYDESILSDSTVLSPLASALGGAGLFTRSYNTGEDRILISGIMNWSNTLLIVDIFNAANGNIVDRYAIVPNTSTYQGLVEGTVRVYSAGSRSAKVYLRCTTNSSSVLFIATQGRLSATITCNNYNNVSISYEGDETQMTEKTF